MHPFELHPFEHVSAQIRTYSLHMHPYCFLCAPLYVHLCKPRLVLYRCAHTDAHTVLVKLEVDRGISFERACEMLEEQAGEKQCVDVYDVCVCVYV